MSDSYYKGYWMVTNRCNLSCSYCVLENEPHQLKLELSINEKKEFISHLYNKLGFRRITLSGGEVLIIGNNPPNGFIELLHHIRKFRSKDPSKNLEIELYTNGTYLDEKVICEMKGVVDMVAITLDSIKNSFLIGIGRKYKGIDKYYEHIIKVCGMLSKSNIKLKLHSVIGKKNYMFLPNEVAFIIDSIENAGGIVSCWKFFQYMSYDVPKKDEMHSIPIYLYKQFKKRVQRVLEGREIRLHFKDNLEMNESLFNILSYGNAQYMRKGDTWSTSRRTKDLRLYNSMSEVFAKHDIDEVLFRKFHEIQR